MTTEPTGFVILHFGPMGVTALDKASKLAGKDAVIDPGAARMAGASFAFGDTALLDALKTRLAAGARQEANTANPGLPQAAREWLATGERGLSSEAIFSKLTGVPVAKGDELAYPHDPSDLRRCRLLLEAVPGFAGRIGEMASVSETWARLVAAWDQICATMDAEAPNWRQGRSSASRTYDLMRSVIGR